jgi:DNA-directed RNA polymerase specialized sigma24 family protein
MPRFPATRWSVVQRARIRGGEPARVALSELCKSYWPPLYAWARRRGHTPGSAEELIQDFFAALLTGDSLLGFDRDRGRFRGWLLGALRHHESRGRERERAGKRGGGVALVPFDAELAERVHGSLAAEELTAEQAYERAWARSVLDRVEVKLRADYLARGAQAELDALAPVVLHDRDARYAVIAAALGKSEGAVKVAAHRLRKRYGELLRAEVADTVDSPDEVEDELRALIAAVR